MLFLLCFFYMQGKKTYQEKLFTNFQLSDRVPKDNFYRQLKEILDFSFLYSATAGYYGTEGQKSIDPVVFFKLLLFGYLENQPSDRRIVHTASMRLDVLYFIGYDIDEELPWHSTLSRTRKLYKEEVFLELFRKVLKQCIDKGLLKGARQAVDSFLVKANAAMSSLIDQEVMKDAEYYAQQLKDNEEAIENEVPSPKAKTKSSNKTRVSTTDPDARMAVKPGKVTKLNYLAQVSVDTSSHIITHIEAFHADKRDSQCLDTVVEKVTTSLTENGLQPQEIIADTNYSSTEALQCLERRGITGFIPSFGGYKPDRAGFTYDKENDLYYCPQGKKLSFCRFRKHHGTVKIYLSKRSDCKNCPMRVSCLGKAQFKSITDTLAKPLFDQMHQRVNTPEGKDMLRLRQSTAEPVIGTLIEYAGLRKVYTKGISLANKCMLLAGMAYNLKKLIRKTENRSPVPSLDKLIDIIFEEFEITLLIQVRRLA